MTRMMVMNERKRLKNTSTMRIIILVKSRTLRTTPGKEWPPYRRGGIGSSGKSKIGKLNKGLRGSGGKFCKIKRENGTVLKFYNYNIRLCKVNN